MFVDNCPVHFTYEGDVQEVEKWIPYARDMFTSMKYRGVPVLNKTPVDGVSIRTVRMKGAYKIHIKAEVSSMVHGLCSLHLTLNNGYWTYEKAKGIEYVIERDGLAHYTPVKAEKKLIPCFNSESETYSFVRDSALTTSTYPQSFNNSPFYKSPGLFTGEMRKVVQTLIGQGKSIPFEPNFNRSHGIWKSNKGIPWVIEIGNRGVLAQKLPTAGMLDTAEKLQAFKDKFNAPGYDLDYIIGDCSGVFPNDNTELLDKISNGTVLKLADASALAGFYSANGYFQECGWAFSTTGKDAMNTAWKWENPALPPSATYIIGILWKVSITDRDNLPSISFLAELESGYLHGDRVVHFKMPGINPSEGLYSFDLSHGNLTDVPPHDTPFYAFYDEEIPVICRYSSGTGTIATPVNTTPPDGWGTLGVPHSSGDGSDFYQTGTNYSINPPTCYSSTFNHYEGTYSSFSGTQESYVWSYRNQAWVSDFSGVIDQNGAECAVVSLDYLDGVENINRSLYSAIVPFHDREAIYFYKITETYREGTGTTRQSYKNYAVYRPGVPIYEVNGGGFVGEYFGTGVVLFTPISLQFGFLEYCYCPQGYPLVGGATSRFPYSGAPAISSDIGDTGNYTLSADTYSASTEELYLVCSKGHSAGELIFGGDSLGKYAPGGNPYLLFIDGITTQFFHVIPDTFTGHRLISPVSNAIGGGTYYISGVPTDYSALYTDVNFYRFFFGVP